MLPEIKLTTNQESFDQIIEYMNIINSFLDGLLTFRSLEEMKDNILKDYLIQLDIFLDEAEELLDDFHETEDISNIDIKFTQKFLDDCQIIIQKILDRLQNIKY